ncbi:MAG: hypothetical protein ACFCVA_08995, partial [Gammaproteobacteria bacterium]
PEQGARQRESGVYKGVHEHFELPRNAAQASAVIFKTASEGSIRNGWTEVMRSQGETALIWAGMLTEDSE